VLATLMSASIAGMVLVDEASIIPPASTAT
jgi:hypothetical protein